ncbi:MAG TPA: response regulator [Anaerolineales bacterium]|nr:response regulator [Anaerolineales bacterium]
MEPKLHILIVDDDQRMTRTLADIFSIAGHTPVEANSGAKALELARSQAFDCILTDVRMPGMDGVELYHQLRQIQPGLPVILMSAYASDATIQKGMEEGIVGIFDKPLDINGMLGFFSSLAKSRSIVIVDDDENFCKTLGDILQQRGFQVEMISNPHAAVGDITGNAQVILLDIKLNSITGLDVLKDIRQSCPDLPVVMVTGYQQEMAATMQAALQINAFICLYKPLEIPALLTMLAELQLKRLRKALKKRSSYS